MTDDVKTCRELEADLRTQQAIFERIAIPDQAAHYKKYADALAALLAEREHFERQANTLDSVATEAKAALWEIEAAEIAHAHCEDCEGEGVPELCASCFPFFDQARVMRRVFFDKYGPPEPPPGRSET
jgi:hypothetical protein